MLDHHHRLPNQVNRMKIQPPMAHKKICKLHIHPKLQAAAKTANNFTQFFFPFRYVIKAVVYEIGILTDADDNATTSDEDVT